MSVLFATWLTMCGAMHIWTESPLVRVFPTSIPTAASLPEARIHAARGERESFQLCIRPDRKPVESIRIEGGEVGSRIPAPEIRRVGFLRVPERPAPGTRTERHPRTGLGAPRAEGNLWPDPLLDFEPFTLSPGETAALWVTYTIPPDAPPGSRQAKLTIRYGDKRKQFVRVYLEVFDFTLPETPSLRTAFPLERKAIGAVYGLEDNAMESWKPIYDALARTRLSYRLWDGGDLVPVAKDGRADTTRLKEHLEYAVTAAHMNSVDVGGGENAAALFPEPPAGDLQDPIQFYLHDIGNWLQDRGWLDRAYLEVMALPERGRWQAARDAYFRVKRNDKRIKRLLVGAGDPYFERYTDIWATPLRQFDPYVDSLLRQGYSLRFKQTYPPNRVAASSSGSLPGDTIRVSQPEDAYDGCLFTFWISKGIPRKSDPQWLRVDLEKPVTTNKIKIIWKRGFEATGISVYTGQGDYMSANSGMKWLPFPPATPYAQSWVEGTFKAPQTFPSIYFEFSETFSGGPVGITELMFGDVLEAAEPEHITPLELWLSSSEGDFPSLAVDAHPVEARAIPWVCWGHQSAGFVHRGLCQWPATWKELVNVQPLVWDGALPARRTRCRQRSTAIPPSVTGNEFLFYPGRTAPIPSIRSELLRDGLEDYEYLVAIEKPLLDQSIKDPSVRKVAERRLYSCDLPAEEKDILAQQILKNHLRMGWALSELAHKEPS